MLTIGVAGHVDHGKTALVRALTGQETDRLAEEKRRGISIELGFAHMDLPLIDGSSLRLALVDMPGHERFVRRMIAGASGVDAVLLVVAADEGVMPQGREHVAICQLLGITQGAVVLTKTDLVDADMLAMAQDDVQALVKNMFLETAPCWSVSVREPDSVAALRQLLATWAENLHQDQQIRVQTLRARPARLAVDRRFSLPGRGTVAAGTLVTGSLAVEDHVSVLPQKTSFRIRGLQQQGQAVATAHAPARVAINLAAATLEDCPIGSVICTPSSLDMTARVDAILQLLPKQASLPPRCRLMLHVGTTQVEAVVTQLSGNQQEPGTDALVQLHLDRPVPIAASEGFVLRGSQVDPRLGQTLGGGRVLHPTPRRHRINSLELLEFLATLAQGRLEDQIVAACAMADARGCTELELQRILAVPPDHVAKALRLLLASGKLRRAGQPTRHYSPAAMVLLEQQLLAIVAQYHRTHPALPGLLPQQAHRDLGAWLDETATQAVLTGLCKRGALVQHGLVLALPEHRAVVAADPEALARLEERLLPLGLQGLTQAQLAEHTGLDARIATHLLQAATAQGVAVRLGEDHYVSATILKQSVSLVIDTFGRNDAFSTSELKELVGLSRKYLIPFAEYLDAARVTVRDPSGNRRVRDRAKTPDPPEPQEAS